MDNTGLCTIMILAIIYHIAMTPGVKRQESYIMPTLLFEFLGCWAIIHFFGFTFISTIVVLYSAITWLPYVTIRTYYFFKYGVIVTSMLRPTARPKQVHSVTFIIG